MKIPTKLRRHIILILGGITLVMVLAYTLLVQYTLISALDDAASYDLHLKARNLAEQYQQDPNVDLPKSRYLTVYLDRHDLPDWLVEQVDIESLGHTELIMDDLSDSRINGGRPVFFSLFTYDLHDSRQMYLLEVYTEKDDIPQSFANLERAENVSIILAVVFMVVIAYTIRSFFKKIATPIQSLLEWASQLTQEKPDQAHPDFRIEEVNLLADLIQNAIRDLHQALNREQNFLNSASHELRTPIAIVRSNMDLLARLRPNPDEKEGFAYHRIRRAVDNMQKLTETLLWLSRKEEAMPASESLEVSDMVRELVQENRHLLEGKSVLLKLTLTPAKATLPRGSLNIALGNLIRNAFQYTNRGEIEIHVGPSTFFIANIEHSRHDGSHESGRTKYGFGVGLALVDQITRKLNLVYENRRIEGGHIATLRFDATEMDTQES